MSDRSYGMPPHAHSPPKESSAHGVDDSSSRGDGSPPKPPSDHLSLGSEDETSNTSDCSGRQKPKIGINHQAAIPELGSWQCESRRRRRSKVDFLFAWRAPWWRETVGVVSCLV